MGIECKKCLRELSEELFYSSRKGVCRECQRKASKEWVDRNYEKKLENNRKWDTNHREEKAERNRVWRESHPYIPVVRRKTKREIKRDEVREFVERNIMLLWVVFISDVGVRYKRNLERNAERRREWKVKNGSRKSHRRKHKVDFLKDKQKGRCAVCKEKLGEIFHVDHRLARANGGGNEVTNLQLLCPKCNLKKSDRDEVEFMRGLGYLL